MSILVCGSLAFDTTMLLTEKVQRPVHNAVSQNPKNTPEDTETYYLVPDLRREYGGCAGNIVYNLKQLEKSAEMMSTVGTDFSTYQTWLDKCAISTQYVKRIAHTYTAQTYITQDMDDHKIIAFHPGAMNFSHYNQVPTEARFDLAVIAPDGEEGMRTHARQLVQLGIPFLFYPGQSLYEMLNEDIMTFIEQADWAVFNQDEYQFLTQITGLQPVQISRRMQGLIINKGEQGSIIYVDDQEYSLPGVYPRTMSDRSGCDDAYCAGLLYGLYNDIDWETSGRIASLMWSIKAEHHGTQQHSLNLERFKQFFQQVYGYALIS